MMVFGYDVIKTLALYDILFPFISGYVNRVKLHKKEPELVDTKMV